MTALSVTTTQTTAQVGESGTTGTQTENPQVGTTAETVETPLITTRPQTTQQPAQRLTSADGEPDWNNLDYEAARKLRQELRSLRQRVKGVETQEADELTTLRTEYSGLQEEFGSVQQTLTTLQNENRQLRAENVLSRVGCLEPELLATKVTDADLASDDAAKDMVKRLKKEHPTLFRITVAGSADGANEGTSTARPKTGSFNNMIRAASGRGPTGS